MLGILNDKEIVSMQSECEPGDRLFEGLGIPDDWYSSSSPVQGASVDLTVGNIFLPNTKPGDEGSVELPVTGGYLLPTGRTAIIATKESINFPPDICAFGFPPAGVSRDALLMTNPGHVDPGYKGHLRFTVINMGHEKFELVPGDRIVTLLLFRLRERAQKDWLGRGGKKGEASPSRQSLRKLAKDFIDVENRIKTQSKKIAKRLLIRWISISAVVGIFLAVIIPLATIGLSPSFLDLLLAHLGKSRIEISDRLYSIESNVKFIEGRLDGLRDKTDIVTLRADLELLKEQTKAISQRLGAKK